LREKMDEIKGYTATAKGIAWDTCHKIYILMDDEQVALMREYEYDPLITSDEMSSDVMAETVIDWYEVSCSLRFVQAVRTDLGDPNAGFIDIIGQFEGEDEDEDEDEYEERTCDCGSGEPAIYVEGRCDACWEDR